MLTHVNITIYGKVQGVFFRHFAKIKAMALEINGFVKNADNGSVYIEAESQKEKLDDLIDWCRHGPLLAKVGDLKIEFSDNIKKFKDFVIK